MPAPHPQGYALRASGARLVASPRAACVAGWWSGEAPGGPRNHQGSPGEPRAAQESPGSPGKPQEAQGSPGEPTEAKQAKKSYRRAVGQKAYVLG